MAHFKHIQPNDVWDTPENTYWDNHAIALRKFSTTASHASEFVVVDHSIG